jgi:hypothetical protein
VSGTASAVPDTDSFRHLAPQIRRRDRFAVDELDEREVLDAILASAQYAHVKLDQILDLLGEDGEEEEDETDG